jgi:hypothetical protein
VGLREPDELKLRKDCDLGNLRGIVGEFSPIRSVHALLRSVPVNGLNTVF